jgi:hypothetical protein
MSEDTTPYEIDASQDLQAYPVWRQAAIQAVAEFPYGAVIPHAWLCANLEIQDRAGLMSAEKHRELDFEMLRKMDGFRDVMLSEHKRYLVNIRGVGYSIVEPPHQTDAAMRRLRLDLHRAIGKTMAALVHINDTVLTIDALRENTEAKSKLAWLRTVGVKRIAKQPQEEQ